MMTAIRESIERCFCWETTGRCERCRAALAELEALEAVAEAARAIHLQYGPENEEALHVALARLAAVDHP